MNIDVGYALLNALETGLPYAIGFLGVWLVFRNQNDFDLTVDSTFTMGGAVAAVWMLHGGNPWLAPILGAASASLGGLLTFAVTRLLTLSLVLASIVINLGLFSVNLAIMGRPNLSIVNRRTIIDDWHSWWHLSVHSQIATIALMAALVLIVSAALALFLLTEVGLGLRASGMNKTMARAVGVSPALMLLVSLVVGNLLTGLSGAIVTEQQGFADVSMGIGTIIFGVTAVLLGEVVVRARGPVAGVATVLVGTIAYRLILALAFQVGVAPELFRGLTALTVLAAVLANRILSRSLRRRIPPLTGRQRSVGLAGEASAGRERVPK